MTPFTDHLANREIFDRARHDGLGDILDILLDDDACYTASSARLNKSELARRLGIDREKTEQRLDALRGALCELWDGYPIQEEIVAPGASCAL